MAFWETEGGREGEREVKGQVKMAAGFRRRRVTHFTSGRQK